MEARRLFWPVYALLLIGVTLVGSEVIASFLVPSYPAREIRPIDVKSTAEIVYNDWDLRDRPRTFERPPGVRFRSVLVGDSFLEGPFLKQPLSAFVEQRMNGTGNNAVEAINFGVSATGPQQYYYRMKHVGLALKPDAIVMAVYAGNDFVKTPFGGWPPPIAELPLPSLLGSVAPRTTWLLVNRLGRSEFGRGNKPIDNEYEQLNGWLALPSEERLNRIVDHMKRHYYPRLSETMIREILARNDDSFWTAFARPAPDREFVAGWLLSGMIDWETGQWTMPRDAEEADRLTGDDKVGETLSWLVAADRMAKENGIEFAVALIPVGLVDPAYAEFWRPWPKYFSYTLSADARHRRIAAALHQTGVLFFDLRDDLAGVSGTYRLTDGHWTQRGTEIVAGRVTRELMQMRRNLGNSESKKGK